MHNRRNEPAVACCVCTCTALKAASANTFAFVYAATACCTAAHSLKVLQGACAQIEAAMLLSVKQHLCCPAGTLQSA